MKNIKSPKWIYGQMHFEDGVRFVLMWRGTKYFHAFFIDASTIYRRFVLFTELKFFKERGNIQDSPRRLKKYLRIFLSKSRLTGLRREMTLVTKKTLLSGVKLINENTKKDKSISS